MSAAEQQYDTVSIEIEHRLSNLIGTRYMVWTATSEDGEDIIFKIAAWQDPKTIFKTQIPLEDVVLLYLQNQLVARVIYLFLDERAKEHLSSCQCYPS